MIGRAYEIIRELPLGAIAPVALLFGFGYAGAVLYDQGRYD